MKTDPIKIIELALDPAKRAAFLAEKVREVRASSSKIIPDLSHAFGIHFDWDAAEKQHPDIFKKP